MKRLLVPVLAVVFLGVLVWSLRPTFPPSTPPREPKPVNAGAEEVISPPEPVLVKSPAAVPLPPKPAPRIWPPVEQVVSTRSPKPEPVPDALAVPPSAQVPGTTDRASKTLPPPDSNEMRRVASWSSEDPETESRLRAILLDSDRAASLNLLALQKLRSLGPETAIPALADYLKTEDSSGDKSSLKPTAAGILADFHHPLAAQALDQIEATTRNEALRLTIISLKSKGKTP